VADLLYTHSHLGETPEDVAAKTKLEQSDRWKEIEHITAIFKYFRDQLKLRTHKRSKLATVPNLLLVLLYTILAIPLFVLAICVELFEPLVKRILAVRNHFTPVDMAHKLFARGVLYLSGVSVSWEGLSYLDYDSAFVGMFSHASNLDPVIVASGPLAFKWIAKKSLFKIPAVGWILKHSKHIPIDRANREKAIESLQKAAEEVRK
jgi:hypothetical protein